MWGHYFLVTLRNLARNKLYGALIIVVLSVSFATAFFIAIYVRDELNFERWIPRYERIYRISAGVHGQPTTGVSPSDVGSWLKLEFPQVEAVTRLLPASAAVRRGTVEFNEPIVWADPSFFTVLPLPLVAGDSAQALEQPDSVVITKSIARKYFGRDAPIGETLLFDREHPMRVTAVLQDLPSNTEFRFGLVASGRASFSELARQDTVPMTNFGQKMWGFQTYFSLHPNGSIGPLVSALPDLLNRRAPPSGITPAGEVYQLTVAPLTDIHLGTGSLRNNGAESAAVKLLYALGIVGVLIVAMACINFINLMTARAASRTTEVGVRKALGAQRSDLIVQFVGEALFLVALSTFVAVDLVYALLPQFNAFLDRNIVLEPLHHPLLIVAALAFALVVGLLAGLYPAFVLSTFRPARVLHGPDSNAPASARLRSILVAAQFAVLTTLAITVIVFSRQNDFALRASLRSTSSQVAILRAGCRSGLKDSLAAVAGVEAVACSFLLPQFGIGPGSGVGLRDGKEVLVNYTAIGAGFLELYGYAPAAGRFFAPRSEADISPTSWPSERSEAIVINETAARKFGYVEASAAVGQVIKWSHLVDMRGNFTGPHDSQVIGVVPDFVVGSVRQPIPAVVFYEDPTQFDHVHLKLVGHDIPETLLRIQDLWARVGEPHPLQLVFVEQRVQEMYRAISRQARLAGIFTAVALFISCLGLFGLASYTAARRTKEIGIRKAMGAGTGAILRLLVFQFVKPVLWAIAIACPVGYYLGHRWLEQFAYHVDFESWILPVTVLASLGVAVLTVSAQCYLVARSSLLTSLHYE